MQFLLDIVVTLVSLFVIGQFVWAMRFHFVTDRMPIGAKVISAVGIITIALFIYLQFTRVQPLGAQLAGLAIEIVASLLFVAAIRASREAQLYYVFEGQKPRSILKSGPYGYIRHPFYTSYLLQWAGWAIATWAPVAIVPVAILVFIYAKAAIGEERNIADSSLAGDYADYRRRAGFFWPRLPI
ncbi:methyltransferase family protein [Pararhizobium haloflavum]|uniref:methyltransferase family protein n=1 Tax=Pararhizobium haloflavum TaxID=2037914 RepID=UPI000C180ADA|nr:isoprenylcysteine carboxylmethyltransferase family protein [Pararhizobium haloflavum]